MKTTGTRMAIWLRIACAVLLLSLGFGHKPVYAAPSSDPASSYYLLPDGTFADLCLDNADHGKPQKSWLGSGCDACRLANGIILPAPPADHAPAPSGYRTIVFQPFAAIVGAIIQRPGSPVRGPPSLAV